MTWNSGWSFCQLSIWSSLHKLVSNDGQGTRRELGIVTLKVRSGMVDKTVGEMPRRNVAAPNKFPSIRFAPLFWLLFLFENNMRRQQEQFFCDMGCFKAVS
jgi:hypothetical protein